MILKKLVISGFLVSCLALANPTVRVVLSAAITLDNFDCRKNQYIDMFSRLARLGYSDPYVVEALAKRGPTFLDNYSQNVYYSQANDFSLTNKGLNEGKTLLDGLNQFDFDDEDMIVKFTGRYLIMTDYFFKLIKNNPGYDAYVKVDRWGNAILAGFAMKCKYLKEAYETLDYDVMEKYQILIEVGMGHYIKRKAKEGNFNIYYVDKLDVFADYHGSATQPGWQGSELY